MDVPKVFISSTIYDVRHVRNEIKKYFESIGFIPMLSEEHSIYYEPSQSPQESCLEEIPKCDIFITIVGSKYGYIEPGESLSIVHKEFNEAIKNKLLIYVCYDVNVYRAYILYKKNEAEFKKLDIKLNDIDDKEVIKFIDDIKKIKPPIPHVTYDYSNDIIIFLKSQLSQYIKKNAFRKRKEKKIVKKPHPKNGESPVYNVESISITIDPLWDKFIHDLAYIGLPRFNYSDIKSSPTLFDLFYKKGFEIIKKNDYYLIKNNNSTLNIGQDVIKMLIDLYKAIKGGK